MTGTDLTGRVAVVTGGGRGIGRAIAAGLAGQGAAVAVTARTAEEIDATAAMITQAGGRALAVAGDVTVLADVKTVLQAAREQFGPVSILVNNAGMSGPAGPVWTGDPEFWWRTQEVHVKGAFLYMHHVLGDMVERGAGCVINIVSLAGTFLAPYHSGYSQAKATLIRLTAHADSEAAPHGVRLFAIEPGTIMTRMAEEALASADVQRWAPDLIRLIRQSQRESDPEAGLANCVGLCLRLLSGRYDALHGQYIDVREDLEERLRQAGAD